MFFPIKDCQESHWNALTLCHSLVYLICYCHWPLFYCWCIALLAFFTKIILDLGILKYINNSLNVPKNLAGIRFHREVLTAAPFSLQLQHSSVLHLFPDLLYLALQSPFANFLRNCKVPFPCLLKLLTRMQVKTELIFKVVLSVKVFIYFRSTWWYNHRRLLNMHFYSLKKN